MSTPLRLFPPIPRPAIPRLAVVSLAAAVGLAVAAVPAAAAGSAPATDAPPVSEAAAPAVIGVVPGSQVVHRDTPYNSTSPKFLTVPCPVGTKLIGTGYVITGASGKVTVDDLRPDGGPSTAPTKLFIGAYETDPYSGRWYVRGYAVCANPLDGLSRYATTSPGNSDDYHAVTAVCPSGKQLVGTGYELNGAAGEAVVDDFLPNGNASTAPTALTVGAYEEDPPYPGIWTVTAYAVCANPVDGLVRVAAASPRNSIDYHFAHGICPDGKQLSGSGFEMNGARGEAVVDDMQPLTDRNRVGAYEEDPLAGKWTLRSYAICAVA